MPVLPCLGWWKHKSMPVLPCLGWWKHKSMPVLPCLGWWSHKSMPVLPCLGWRKHKSMPVLHPCSFCQRSLFWWYRVPWLWLCDVAKLQKVFRKRKKMPRFFITGRLCRLFLSIYGLTICRFVLFANHISLAIAWDYRRVCLKRLQTWVPL